MKRIAFVVFGLLVAVGWAPRPGLAASPPPSPAGGNPAEAAALVRQLGASSFPEREEASRRLAALGRSALSAVQAGLKDEDPEVRRRCADLLPQVERLVLEPRLTALLDGTDTFSPPLPAWEQFRALGGNDLEARMLYVELHQNDKPWLEQVQRDPKGAARQVPSRAAQVQRLLNAQPNGKPADGRLRTTDLAGLFLASAGDPTDNLQTFYGAINVLYQQEVQNHVRCHTALRRLVERFLARRGTTPSTFYPTAHAARVLGLKELLDGTLRPAALRQLDAALLAQPVDVNTLSQAVNMVANLEMHDQVPERVKRVAEYMAEGLVKQPIDQNRFYMTLSLLQNLRMHTTIDRVLKPAVYQLAQGLAEQNPDVNRFYQVHSMCQTLNLPDATEALKPAACKLVAEAVRSENAARFAQAVSLAQSLDLREALEGVIKPAVRKQVLAALEQPDDLARLGRVCNLAISTRLELVEDTLKPVLRRQAKSLLDGTATLKRVHEVNQIAQALKAHDVIDNQVKPALRKAVLDACARPVKQGTLDQTLALARQLQVKEVANLAVKGALTESLTAYSRGQAILFVAVLGTPEQAKQLEPLLADTTILGTINFNGTPTTAELRDVVLAGLVHKSGQRLSDYGYSQFATLAGPGAFPPSPTFFGFPGKADRDQALTRWKKWCADQKK